MMSDGRNRIEIFEYPNLVCELMDINTENCIAIRTLEDAEAIVSSLQEMIRQIKDGKSNDSRRV